MTFTATIDQPVSNSANTLCKHCQAGLAPIGRRGRPRRYCTDCLPPVSEIGFAEYGRRWRELNESYVQDYNAERRQVTTSVECVHCGRTFERRSQERHVYCSPSCGAEARKQRRKRERRAA